MKKFLYVMRCIKEMNFKNMLERVDKVHQKSKKPKIVIFLDMVWCGLRYGAGYRDYELNAWWTLNRKQRKTYITRAINNKLVSKLNNPQYTHLLENKVEFNQMFEKFLGRKWLNLATASFEDFENFTAELDEIIAKPIADSCGHNVFKISKNKFSSIRAMYDYILKTNSVLVEEYVIQNKTIASLHPSSINTLRIVTLRADDGKNHILYAFIRIGNEGRVVDNINSGGMAAPIDLESGIINNIAFDKNINYYEFHPITGTKIVGLQIPMWKEAKNLVLEAAELIPQIRYIGWDVALTESAPILIEANYFPGHDLLQMPPHVPNKIGMLPQYKKFIKI